MNRYHNATLTDLLPEFARKTNSQLRAIYRNNAPGTALRNIHGETSLKRYNAAHLILTDRNAALRR